MKQDIQEAREAKQKEDFIKHINELLSPLEAGFRAIHPMINSVADILSLYDTLLSMASSMYKHLEPITSEELKTTLEKIEKSVGLLRMQDTEGEKTDDPK